jgi:hypothetical protein
MRPARFVAALPLLLAAAPAPPLAPGLWEETLVFALDSVNGSPDLAARMQGALPAPAPQRTCRTAAELADPRALLMEAGDGQCRFTRFEMANGTLTAAGDCAAPSGQSMHVEGTGTYTAAGYDFSFTGTGHAGQLDMVFRGRDSGRRIAACPPANGIGAPRA